MIRCHYIDVLMSSMASQITGVSIVYSTVCSGADQRKHQSSTSLVFVRGIHRWPVDSPHKRLVTRKMFPFDDVIMSYPSCIHLPASVYHTQADIGPILAASGRYQPGSGTLLETESFKQVISHWQYYQAQPSGMELSLFNDDTCPSGHISRPTHFSDIICSSFVIFNYVVIWILWLMGFNVPNLAFLDSSYQVKKISLLQIFSDR